MKNLLILLILLMSVEHVHGMDVQDDTDCPHQVAPVSRIFGENNQPKSLYKTPSQPYVNMERFNKHYPQNYFNERINFIVSKLVNRRISYLKELQEMNTKENSETSDRLTKLNKLIHDPLQLSKDIKLILKKRREGMIQCLSKENKESTSAFSLNEEDSYDEALSDEVWKAITNAGIGLKEDGTLKFLEHTERRELITQFVRCTLIKIAQNDLIYKITASNNRKEEKIHWQEFYLVRSQSRVNTKQFTNCLMSSLMGNDPTGRLMHRDSPLSIFYRAKKEAGVIHDARHFRFLTEYEKNTNQRKSALSGNYLPLDRIMKITASDMHNFQHNYP